MAFVTTYWVLDIMLIFTSLMVAIYFYMTRNFKYWKRRGVEEMPPIPIIGNFTDCFLLKKTPGYFIKDLYEQSKGLRYIGFYVFDKPCLMIRDRELVKNVLVKDFNYFDDRYGSPDKKNDRLGYANLFFLKNPAWKVLRTKLTPFFTSGKLKKMFELILKIVKDMDTYLDRLQLGSKGRILEVKDLAGKIATDMIGTTAFGLQVNSLNNPDAEFRKYGKEIFDYDFIRGFEMLSLFFLPNLVRTFGIKFLTKDSSHFLRSAFWDVINQRVQSGVNRNDLIDTLIELRKNHVNKKIEGFEFDGDDLVAQAVIFFIGGFESSSVTIAFALYELAVQPKIQDKLRKEIRDALNASNGEITYDMIMTLPYLDMVISETLRIYPTLPFLDRVTSDRYEMPDSDLVLEKGTPIYISMLGMHFDPEYFPDPLKFDPERFSEENKRNIPSSVYFPFGDGPRACIGTRLGLLQTKLAVMKIISRCEVTTCEKTLIPMKLNPKAPTTSPLGGGIYLNIRDLAD